MSTMRKTILGSTDIENGDATPETISNPAANTLLAALPADLRAVLKPMTKYTNNVGKSSEASAITSTIDYLPLMADFEVFGTTKYANTNEKTYQAQYQYYKIGKGKIKYKQNNTTAAGSWWLRSPSSIHNATFCIVEDVGSALGGGAVISFGIAPVFLV